MARLGYARYGAQGGDWGAQVATRIGALDPEHCAAIHLNMAIAGPPEEPVAAHRRGAGRPRGDAALPARGVRLRERAGDQAADARRRAQRLARRAARLDRREVPHLERLRRPPRERLHPRPAAHQRDAVLGHADDRVVGAPVLGAPAQRLAAGARRSTSRFPPASRATRRRSCASRARGSSGATTSRTGPTCRAAATSPPWSSPSSSSTTCGPSSEPCADSSRSATIRDGLSGRRCHGHAERRERVGHRVDDRRRRADRAALADALVAARARARRLDVAVLDHRAPRPRSGSR